MFFESEVDRIKRKLFETAVHVPKHEHVDVPSGASDLEFDQHRWAFVHFDGFHDHLHRIWPYGPWRLERRSDPYLSLFKNDAGPTVGIAYRVFYNSLHVGAE